MKTILGVLLMLGLGGAAAGDVQLSSGSKQTTLVELYTSEGCNSCPPAEAYLNGLEGSNGLWTDYVPVAFHVDYWDELGWIDRYAQAEFGKRQSRYAQINNQRSVFTPAFVVNGAGWRPGVINRSIPANDNTAGELKVALNGDNLAANFQHDGATDDLVLNIAVLGMDITSKIEAGENAGRTAQHDFVVVGYKAVPGDGAWQTSLPKLHYDGAKRLALAAWISRADNPTPLQVVGGEIH